MSEIIADLRVPLREPLRVRAGRLVLGDDHEVEDADGPSRYVLRLPPPGARIAGGTFHIGSLPRPSQYIVSAMSGETDRLLKLARALSPEPAARESDVVVASGEQGVPSCQVRGRAARHSAARPEPLFGCA